MGILSNTVECATCNKKYPLFRDALSDHKMREAKEHDIRPIAGGEKPVPADALLPQSADNKEPVSSALATRRQMTPEERKAWVRDAAKEEDDEEGFAGLSAEDVKKIDFGSRRGASIITPINVSAIPRFTHAALMDEEELASYAQHSPTCVSPSVRVEREKNTIKILCTVCRSALTIDRVGTERS